MTEKDKDTQLLVDYVKAHVSVEVLQKTLSSAKAARWTAQKELWDRILDETTTIGGEESHLVTVGENVWIVEVGHPDQNEPVIGCPFKIGGQF